MFNLIFQTVIFFLIPMDFILKFTQLNLTALKKRSSPFKITKESNNCSVYSSYSMMKMTLKKFPFLKNLSLEFMMLLFITYKSVYLLRFIKFQDNSLDNLPFNIFLPDG